MINLSLFFVFAYFLTTLLVPQAYAYQVPLSRSTVRSPFSSSSKPVNNVFLLPMAPPTTTSIFSATPQEEEQSNTVRDGLRQVTGFSLTAFRAAWRAATGISLTAIYASTLAATGLWIRNVTATLLSIFPAWFRYFLQPFLVLYYAPLFIVRCLAGPTGREARKKHKLVVDGFKQAVDFAEKTEKDGYWPVHLNADGNLELVKPPKPSEDKREQLAKAVEESVEKVMKQKKQMSADDD